MSNSPHHSRRSRWSSLFSNKVIQRAACSCLLLLVSIVVVSAQADDTSSSSAASSAPQSSTEGIQKRWNEFGVWGGISFHSPTLIGKTPDSKFGNIGLRYGRVLAASKTVAFEWTIDAIPLAILSNNRFTVVPSGTGFIFTQTRKSVYGWGAAPIGLKFNFRRNRRVQPFGQATGGFLYFNEQVPIAGAARFNFTFDFSGGVQIVNTNRRAFTNRLQVPTHLERLPGNLQSGRGRADGFCGVFGVQIGRLTHL